MYFVSFSLTCFKILIQSESQVTFSHDLHCCLNVLLCLHVGAFHKQILMNFISRH